MITKSAIYYKYHIGTNSIYIGKTKNYKKRMKEHNFALKNKLCHNKQLQKCYDIYGSENIVDGIIQFAPPNTKILLELEKYYIKQFSKCCTILNDKKGDYNIKLITPYLHDPYSLFIKNCFQKVYPSSQTPNIYFESTPITIQQLHQEFLISLVSTLSEKYDDTDVFKAIFEMDLDLCDDSLLKLFIYFPNYFIFKFLEEYCNSAKLFLRHNIDNIKNNNRSTQKPFFSLSFQEFFSFYQGHTHIYSKVWSNILLTAISDLNNMYLEKFPIPNDFMSFLDLSKKYNLYVSSYINSLNYDITHAKKTLEFLKSNNNPINPMNIAIYNDFEKNIICTIKALDDNLNGFYAKKFPPRYRVQYYINNYYPEFETPRYDFNKSIPFDWILGLDNALDFNKYF